MPDDDRPDVDIGQRFDRLGQQIDVHRFSSNGHYHHVRQLYTYVGFAIDIYWHRVCSAGAYPANQMGLWSSKILTYERGFDDDGLESRVQLLRKRMRWLDKRLGRMQRELADDGDLQHTEDELWRLHRRLQREAASV